MKKIVFIFLLINYSFCFGQGDILVKNSYPANYFDNPMDIPLVLSGTFAELRSNHFHSGLDIKTKQREGIEVFSSAEGYISRIKVSLWGFGKAIYITHPNGYTTVYAHLQKFSDRIENYIKKEQYRIENFEVEVFPTQDELPVSRKELIAFSGRTGGYMGPHLHFEIRDSKTERTINPLYFGFKIGDSKNPTINTLMGYALDNDSQINQINKPSQLTLIKSSDGNLVANKIYALGNIGFGINAYDQLNDAHNHNGIYSLETFLNGQKYTNLKLKILLFMKQIKLIF